MDNIADLLTFDLAGHQDALQFELMAAYNRYLQSLNHTDSTRHLSHLSSTLYIALTYITGIIVATYLIVQAMETVSFVLSPNAGLIWKLLWVLFISTIGVFVARMCIVAVGGNFEDAQMPWWVRAGKNVAWSWI
jgi:hypothetical protein